MKIFQLTYNPADKETDWVVLFIREYCPTVCLNPANGRVLPRLEISDEESIFGEYEIVDFLKKEMVRCGSSHPAPS